MGLFVSDCAVVKIEDDIPKELIVERLCIEDCGVVKCCEELEDAVTMICTDVGRIGAEGSNKPGIDGVLSDVFGGNMDTLETKVINAADYVL